MLLVLDNATWHNRLTDDTMPPKRSWRKELISDWLRRHRISIPEKATKAELLELAFDNLPEKRYIVDEAAAAYDIDILRLVVIIVNPSLIYNLFYSLPVKHYMFNPIELAWAGLKNYVREHNTNFRLSDVRNLSQTWMDSLDASTAASYIEHAQNIENTFKKSDCFAEQVEEQIIDDEDNEEDEMDSEEGETSE